MFKEAAEFTSAINGKRLMFRVDDVAVVWEGKATFQEEVLKPAVTHITTKVGGAYPVKEDYDTVIERFQKCHLY